MTVCDGAAGEADITLTGLDSQTTRITSIINLTDSASVSLAGLVIETDKFHITASTSAKKLLVMWCDLSLG